MADQLRWDYLSCAGHPTIQTPNIDELAARGIRFTNAYAQNGICGPSRMSFYTGRYVSSHGCSWNQVPLNIGTWTLGDYLRPLGVKVALTGKTHMATDIQGMQRLGLSPGTPDGILASQCGFEPNPRDDGLHPDQSVNPNLAYNTYLKEQGYDGDNPWHNWANSADNNDGEIVSGWLWRNSNKPARIKAEHSETPWMTSQAIDFIKNQGESPWCLHLSYIKPHWPYMAPEPYFSMYSDKDITPVNRTDDEKETAHPVMKAFMAHEEGQTFLRDDARKTIIPSYMALITQLDDEIGRLVSEMEKMGRMEDTLIVFTSDHGDYLGDHWLGEKELFHDASIKIPLILCHPDNAATGEVDDLVEAIDLIPTFIEALGGDIPGHMLEGRSLIPYTKSLNTPDDWRDIAIAELDYNHRKARLNLGRDVNECKGWMIRGARYKYVYFQGFLPQLFDLENDPYELYDLGGQDGYADICEAFKERLMQWFMAGQKKLTTLSDKDVEARTDSWKQKGVLFGVW